MMNVMEGWSFHRASSGANQSSHDWSDGGVGEGIGEGDGSVTVRTSGRRGRLL